jgi:release factor glutamine methyltransferase
LAVSSPSLSQAEGNKNTAFTVRMAQSLASALFHQAMIDNGLLEAQLLLGEVLKKTRIDVQLLGTRFLNEHEIDLFWQMVSRRLTHEPMAYIIGKKEFYGHDFFVSKDCLIPRPDTESIVEKCLTIIKPLSDAVVFDIGTGSGAIAISLLLLRPRLSVFASDISEKALSLAKINAKHHDVFSRLRLLQGDLLAPFSQKARLIVSNPPYIATGEINTLSSTVRNFEPHLALDGGDDGLIFYRRLLRDAYEYLESPGYLVMETGFSQKEAILKLITNAWHSYEFFEDLARNQRGIVLEK